MSHDTEKWNIEFAVRRSCRYHNSRRGFYELMHKFTAFLIIVLSSGSFLSLCTDEPKMTLWASLLITVLATLDLVIGFSTMAIKHERLFERFNALLIEMKINKTVTDDLISEWTRKRLEIESAEPTVYRAVDASCHNAESQAVGYERGGFYYISFFTRMFMHLIKFQNKVWKKNKEITDEKLKSKKS